MLSSPAVHMWRMRLISALRTALACGVVGGATLYGPEFFVKDIKFSAFSYLTVVLIVPDATLGLAFRGCWHALCATVQVVPLAMLARWWWPIPLPVGAAVLAAAAASFLVALPEFTHLAAKRIAFGQIVLVCTDTVLIGRGGDSGVMHPVYVAASTGLGVLASVLALLLPYPDLATHKVTELCELYGESAHQRINLYWKAKDMIGPIKRQQLLSRAKPLAENGAKLLQSITTLQDGMRWERPLCRYSKPNPTCLLRTMERQIRGMEYSLASSSSSSSFPAFSNQQTNNQLSNILQAVSSKLEQQPQMKQEIQKPSSWPSPAPPWLHFYSSCAETLTKDDNDLIETPAKNDPFFTTLRSRLEFGFKCSVSLSLALLLGLTFDRENACWAGLTVAISLVEGRQAVFAVANSRAQGTAVGSVYGLISCFLLHREELRLAAALLPWVVFAAGSLRHSRIYGQAGGVTAAIGALLILGRKDYGDPTGFAVARLAEVFIGLSVFAAVEVSMRPVRAATLARSGLSRALLSLEECLKDETNLGKPRNKFDCMVSELGEFVCEAEVEPDFWCLPFPARCYRKVVGSLADVADMMWFVDRLSSSDYYEYWRERVNNELGMCRETIRSSRGYLETSARDEKSSDLEAGDFRNADKINIVPSTTEQREGHVNQAMGAIEFCVTSLTKEINYINICIIEICG